MITIRQNPSEWNENPEAVEVELVVVESISFDSEGKPEFFIEGTTMTYR